MSTFQYLVTVTVERESGKFASRDEIDDALRSALEEGVNDADLYSLGADGDSVYNVTDADVADYTAPKAAKA